MAIGNLKQVFSGKRLRWAGLTLSVLLVGAMAASGKYVTNGGFTFNTGGVDSVSVSISRGGVAFEFGRSLRESAYDKLIWAGWRSNEKYGFNLQPRIWASDAGGGLPSYGYLYLPLWIPILLIVPWTGYRWWKDRAPPPGLCRKCRYDLAGLGAGVCPECGTMPLSVPDAERLFRRSRRVEAALFGLAVGALAGWTSQRFSFDGGAVLYAMIGGVAGSLVGACLGRFIASIIQPSLQRIRRFWTTRKD